MTIKQSERGNEMDREMIDSREGFDGDYDGYEGFDGDYDGYEEWLDDGQPTEYEEWQDVYGGDDWDHGQYDHHCDW